jgi:uncharacterized protein YkwD
MTRLWFLVVCAAACGDLPPGGGTTSGGSGGTTAGTTGGGTTGGTTGGGTTGTSSDPFVQHNLEVLNMYRAANNAPALVLSDALNTFAATGSQQLAAGGPAHGHFQQAITDHTLFSSGFCSGAGENQAPGWAINNDENKTIDAILKSMMDEGPGGGHHDNIVNPQFRLVGVGLLVQGGGLYFTNDFSNACP